jgi:methanogenesis multiheme c-type cytochrome
MEKYAMTRESGFALIAVSVLLTASMAVAAPAGIEDSYHGQLGRGTGLGMLEKWCALPNFDFGDQGGIEGWTSKDCNGCHVGASWNPTRRDAVCTYCHTTANPTVGDTSPTISKCLTCHKKDKAKRGDNFSAAADVHLAAGFVCQDCHIKVADSRSDHQFAKGRAIDTTEPTLQGTLTCTTGACHDAAPHPGDTDRAAKLNNHTTKVACETCHTGLRAPGALISRSWTRFTSSYAPITVKQSAAWLPVHKWYDNQGAGASGDYHLPILGFTERKRAPGAKVYPFNAVTVDWYVKKKKSDYDQVIIVPEVVAADSNGDFTVTLDEMRAGGYPKATLKVADMNFSISHSVGPASTAFECSDCHGKGGWVLDWSQLGYAKDPGGGKGGKK